MAEFLLAEDKTQIKVGQASALVPLSVRPAKRKSLWWLFRRADCAEITKRHIKLFCHSGLDPWFDTLTTLSKVEGESSIFLIVLLLDAGSSPA